MDITELTYPDFTANQVLTSAHLNDLREYLDEQTRLTRANLIGVGVACGLEVSFEPPGTIRLTRGVGVTSQGYLIVEPVDLTLVTTRPYTLPTDPGYGPFVDRTQDPAAPFDLWELFPDDDVPGAAPLASIGPALADKAVVLFLELNRTASSTCSPVDCDDRGTSVTATLRRLLVDVADLDTVIAAADALDPTHLGADLAERLGLPDLRMPRVDVPNTGPVAPEEVLRAFQDAFRTTKLAAATASALTALYHAVRPLVVDAYPSDPFAGFGARFGFLDSTPATTAQVLFAQYYWDLFDDLLAAYDEVRWKGVDLMCACCPPEGMFPRHLMAGVLDAGAHDPARYRHRFLRSPAGGDCVDRSREVGALFTRLVRMVGGFTEQPPALGVRVTPSRWGEAPLSDKAIPYYFDLAGTPPLHHVWDPRKAARGRANQNLGYRSGEYAPPPPAFVSDPLRFDLEPNNFLRIEGHLGSDVRGVLTSLLALRRDHRLPFEVVALRTGTFDEGAAGDLDPDDCRFEDLETLHRVLASELACFLVKQAQYLYALPSEGVEGEQPVAVSLAVLARHAPTMLAQPGTLGRSIEASLTWRPGRTHPRILAIAGTPHLPSQALALVVAMSDLHESMSDDLRTLDLPALATSYHRLVEIAHQTEEFRRSGAFDEPGLSERLDDIVFRCRLDPFEALAAEYARRRRDVQQAEYLGHFLGQHPGVQHKAGVPLGGTFVLVYHAAQKRPSSGGPGSRVDAQQKLLAEVLGRLQDNEALATDPDVRFLVRATTGKELAARRATSAVADKVYRDAVAALSDGAVIADFFLPYACCSDCTPIQFTLPAPRLVAEATVGCTNADGFAEVTLTSAGATGTLSAQVDGGPFEDTSGALLLPVGHHTVVVRDGAGNESRPLPVPVPPRLVITAPATTMDPAGTFQVSFTLEGGTPPYATDRGSVDGAAYASGPIPVAETLVVTVKDAHGCTVEASFESGVGPCELPCQGDSIRAGLRFWLPEARPNQPLNEYRADVQEFTLALPDGTQVDLRGEVADIVNRAPSPIRSADFAPLVGRWLAMINRLVAEHVGSDQWFRLEYEAPDGGTTGTLFADRLSCLDFRFTLAVSFLQGRRPSELELSYSSAGTVVADRRTDGKAAFPPFGGSASNKCRPDQPPVARCEGADLALAIRHEGAAPDVVVLSAKISGQDAPVAFLWEVADGLPSLGGEERIEVTFQPIEPVEKLVRLTVFTEKGCSVVAERVIDVTRPEG